MITLLQNHSVFYGRTMEFLFLYTAPIIVNIFSDISFCNKNVTNNNIMHELFSIILSTNIKRF